MSRVATARRGRMSATPAAIKRFIRDTRLELQKVTWPTRREAWNLTLVVIALSVALGIVLGGVDYILARIVTAIL